MRIDVRSLVSPAVYGRSAEAPKNPDERASALFRGVSLLLVAVSLVLALALGLVTDVCLDAEGIPPLAWLIAALLVVSRIMRRSGHSRIADAAGAFAVAWIGAVSGAFLALLGLRLHFPLADPLLLRADHALYFDGAAVISALVQQGQWIFTIMAKAYGFTVPILAFSMCFLAVTGRRLEAWRACLCFKGSLLTTCVIALFAPAKGLGLWMPPELMAHLPRDAMVSFWPNFDTFYSGRAPHLGIRSISGVISFPSFHAAMGFIVVAMWRANPVTLAAACTWLFFMLLSTFAYGGHYFVDVIGGLAISAGWFVFSRQLQADHAPASGGLEPAPAHA